VRQGCSLSPCLFNLYVQEAIDNRVRELIQVGIKIQDGNVDMLRFADDIAVLTESDEDLRNILTTMSIMFDDEYNMKINQSKTKILVCRRHVIVIPVIKLEGDTLEVVEEYKYLGSMVISNGRCDQEITTDYNRHDVHSKEKTAFQKYRYENKEKFTEVLCLEYDTLWK